MRPPPIVKATGRLETRESGEGDDIELCREMFRRPRDALLCLAAEFLSKGTARLAELKKYVNEQTKLPDLVDQRGHTVSPHSTFETTQLVGWLVFICQSYT